MLSLRVRTNCSMRAKTTSCVLRSRSAVLRVCGPGEGGSRLTRSATIASATSSTSLVSNHWPNMGGSLAQGRLEQLAHLGGIARHLDAAGFHHRELLLRRALAAGDDGAGMAHALARRRGDAGDEADDGLFHVALHPLGGGFLVRAADLADHDHGVGIGVVVEELEHVHVLEAVHRIAADAHRGGLPDAELGELCHRLVGQGAGARHHPDAPLPVDVARHDADLELFRRDHARAVRSEQQRLAVLLAHAVAHFDHVAHRDALGDADGELQVRLHRLPDRGGREWRRHVDHRNAGAGILLCVAHRAEDRDALEILARLLRVDAGDEARAAIGVVAAGARVELAGVAGDALRHHPRIPVDEDAHFFFLFASVFRPACAFALAFGADLDLDFDIDFPLGFDFTLSLGFGLGLVFALGFGLGFAFFAWMAATILCPACAMLSAEMMGRPESLRICLPRSSLVPFMRTTSGTESFTSRAAATTPVAMVAPFVVLPKTLT